MDFSYCVMTPLGTMNCKNLCEFSERNRNGAKGTWRKISWLCFGARCHCQGLQAHQAEDKIAVESLYCVRVVYTMHDLAYFIKTSKLRKCHIQGPREKGIRKTWSQKDNMGGFLRFTRKQRGSQRKKPRHMCVELTPANLMFLWIWGPILTPLPGFHERPCFL